jgi:pilus assembly protein CpaE
MPSTRKLQREAVDGVTAARRFLREQPVRAGQATAAVAPARRGIVAVLQDQATLDRLQGVIRELQLDDELVVTDTLDAALKRMRSGIPARLLVLDLADLQAPITEVGAARAVGGVDLEIVALGSINDVALYRDLLSAGASDYLIKPPSREALAAILEKRQLAAAGADGKPGQIIAFVGSRGGVGATTLAVACAWLLAEERSHQTALLDLDLHFGTVALKLDTDPGSGLCEALEQPSRIDSLFIERATIKVTERLSVLAAETSAAQHLIIDSGAIDMLLYELRRKFPSIVVDLPRGATPMHRVVLAAATHVVVICERSLAGLRDTIRLQTLVREQAPQARLWLVEAGAAGERALIGRSEFEKGIGKAFDARLSYDPKSAGAAANSGQPLPMAAPRSPIVREIGQLAALLAGPAAAAPKRRLFDLRSLW